VTGRLSLTETIQTVERTYRKETKLLRVKEEEWEKVRTETRDLVITETGQGAPPAPGAAEGLVVSGTGPCEYQKTIIRRVISREVKVE